MKNKISTFIAVSGVVAIAATADADTITARFTTANAQTVNITSPTLNGNVNTVSFNWVRQDSPAVGVDSSIAHQFNSFCVDLAQVVSANNDFTYQVVSPIVHGFTPTQTTLLERLWADYFPAIDTANESAAFQVAVWEIIHDSTPDLASGTFKVNSAPAPAALATSWLTNVSAVSYVAANPIQPIVVLRSPSAQDQITVVPAPATGALAGMGVLALASRRRNR